MACPHLKKKQGESLDKASHAWLGSLALIPKIITSRFDLKKKNHTVINISIKD